MKTRAALWIFFAAAMSNISGSQGNYDYYKNVAIKALRYPFYQFWNSPRTTKAKLVAMGTVGALVILGGKKLKEWNQDTINSQLKKIEGSINSIKAIKASRDKQKVGGRKIHISDVSNLKRDLPTLIAETSEFISKSEEVFGKLLNPNEEQKTRLKNLKRDFEEVQAQLQEPLKKPSSRDKS